MAESRPTRNAVASITRTLCYRKERAGAGCKSRSAASRARGQTERLNLFFGVCPRLGGKGRFDLAWQIRTVRALWTDIDHITVDEARERVANASLPPPSIIVNSGNGAHLYWLLDAPYLIDDAGDPPPVETEWTKTPDGQKKPRKYVVENGEKVYLDQRRHVSRLSPKAEHLQDVLAGIAKTLGGDHTTDLSRLLRLPGTLNRKDQRNGREPVPTALVECDPDAEVFARDLRAVEIRFAGNRAGEADRGHAVAEAAKISDSKADKLAELDRGMRHCAGRQPVRSRFLALLLRNPQRHRQGRSLAAGAAGRQIRRRRTALFRPHLEQGRNQVGKQQLESGVGGPCKRRNKRGGRERDDDDSSGNDPGLVAALAQQICEGQHFAQDDGGKLYRYQGGVYRSRAEAFVKAEVKKLCAEMDRLAEWSRTLPTKPSSSFVWIALCCGKSRPATCST